jgi:hypothetical protein
MDQIIFFTPITEVIIATYVLGFGLLITPLLYDKEDLQSNLNELCIIGFCITLPLAQITNFFFPINRYFFYITYLIAIGNIYFHRDQLRSLKKWILKLIIIFIIFLPFKYVLKGNEDLYYHLPKVNFLNQFKIIFGIAHINPSLSFTNGWAHISSVFNFLNGGDKNLYLSSYVFYILVVLTLYDYIKKSLSNNIKIFFSVLILFIIIKFNRLQEFGNDYQSMLLILLTLSLFLKYFFDNDKNKKIINKIIFFSFFAFMFRIYAVFIFPMFIIFLKERWALLTIINKKIIAIILITLISTSLTSLANSGCFFIPIEKTCIDKSKVSWSYQNYIKNLNLHLKSFNTSYGEYKKENKDALTKENWITNFNWFKYHISTERFLKPLVKTLTIILSIFIIFAFKYRLKVEKSNFKKISFLSLASLSLLLWLLITPLFRAGGFSYVSFFTISLLILTFGFKKNFELKNLRFLLLIFMVLINLINVNRLNKEIKKYQTSNPFFFTKWHKLNSAYYLHYIDLLEILNSGKGGNVSNIWKIIKKNNYWVILRNND